MKKAYRIKTKDEFISDFGVSWMEKVGWNSEMNFLFGEEINKYTYDKGIYKGWAISPAMVVKNTVSEEDSPCVLF